jgi:hypothetical protein
MWHKLWLDAFLFIRSNTPNQSYICRRLLSKSVITYFIKYNSSKMKKILILCATFPLLSSANAQAPKQIKWTIAAKRTSPNSALILYKATLSPTWHIWSQNPGDDMLIPPTWTYNDKTIKNVGLAKETGKKISKTEEGFKGKLSFYEGSVVFAQKVSLGNQKTVSGSINYQICDPKSCLPPTDHKFSISLK